MKRLMIVDDEQSISWALTQLAAELGWEARAASSAEQAWRIAGDWRPDAIVLDVRLPGVSGLDAMQRLKSLTHNAPIIVITAYGDLRTAVEAVRQGAFEYVVKPFDSDQIQAVIERAFASCEGAREPAGTGAAVAGFVGESPAMQQVYNRLALAASSDVPVLLQGESGVGKELAARAIHRFSRRGNRPLVVVNLASLSPELTESELFGHVKGAFTGADQAKSGLLAAADGGTLFLDEVAEIPPPTQVKLLRVVEQGEFSPVGSHASQRVDFRLICATHRDLAGMVRRGEFRHDLFFRIAAFPIEIPPLRERGEDVVALARHFAVAAQGGQSAVLSSATLDELRRREWVGNVRELRNAMEHAVLMSRGAEIQPVHLPPPALAAAPPPAAAACLPPAPPRGASPANDVDAGSDPVEARLSEAVAAWVQRRLQGDPAAQNLYDQLLSVVERPLLQALLRRHQGSVAAAARAAGIHRTTFRRKLERGGDS